MFIYFHLFERQNDKERQIHWLIPQLPKTTGAGPGEASVQHPIQVPRCMVGVQGQTGSPAGLPDEAGGSCTRRRGVRTHTSLPIEDVGIPTSDLS